MLRRHLRQGALALARPRPAAAATPVAARSPLLLRTAASSSQVPERLVILGTGWGSFRVLNDIDAKKYQVSVISPRNHLLFTPMLASSALGTVNQRSICQPVRPLVAKKGAKYYESSVDAIDKVKKEVHCITSTGQQYKIPYDKLIIGVGFQPNDFNIPGVKEHALFMKETADATVFKDHVLMRLEEASYLHALDSDLRMSDEEAAKCKEILTFVVIGGGPTGVELAGELTDFLQSEGKKLYPHLQPFITVHMFTYDLLNTFDRELQEHALRHLTRKQGVNLHLEAFVQNVTATTVTVKRKGADGKDEELTIPYGTLVWCAGIKPHKFVRDFGCQMNIRGTQILVDLSLKVKDEKDIYALGDCCTIEDYWLPQTAQVANQQGQFLAKLLNDKVAPGKEPQFVFKSKGMMAYVGGFEAVMSKLPGLHRLTGFVAFLGWRFTYWFLQLSMRNRYMLSTDWFRTLVFGRDLTRFGPRSRPT